MLRRRDAGVSPTGKDPSAAANRVGDADLIPDGVELKEERWVIDWNQNIQ